MPANALIRAQKVGKEAPARLLLFCSLLLLLEATLWLEAVLRKTRLVAFRAD